MRRAAPLGIAALAISLTGCQAGYYAQLVRGQYQLLMRREPIEEVIASPQTDATLRARLGRALDARRFATQVLALPDNGSYTDYADLGRPYALWNVFATPELSMASRQWCYPLAGCMAYRGYYDLDDARAESARLAAAGFDVHIGGVPAYSTLGWFDDPVLNTIVASDDQVTGTIFHELAHQRRYIKGDTAFNESFATFVEQEGLRQYLGGAPGRIASALQRRERDREFIGLMLDARERLAQLYASALTEAEKRQRKAAEFERLRERYAAARAGWGGDAAYDGWLAGPLNNARLLPFGLYHQWVPAFNALYAQVGSDWTAFHAKIDELAETEPEVRQRQLEALTPP
ncbi:MAG TPA: aminopeptidase [Verrucomicrobiae bacterium]|nr:aminopeptidase [Verrucomicrobiae bacterium]